MAPQGTGCTHNSTEARKTLAVLEKPSHLRWQPGKRPGPQGRAKAEKNVHVASELQKESTSKKGTEGGQYQKIL